jgi:steroid 5-alpha reductase family enzyme
MSYVVTAGKQAELWPGIGAFLLSLLFQGSTLLTEAITVEKYPRYVEYQRRVPRFAPWWLLLLIGVVIVLVLRNNQLQ